VEHFLLLSSDSDAVELEVKEENPESEGDLETLQRFVPKEIVQLILEHVQDEWQYLMKKSPELLSFMFQEEPTLVAMLLAWNKLSDFDRFIDEHSDALQRVAFKNKYGDKTRLHNCLILGSLIIIIPLIFASINLSNDR
jgi:hypothetical protein